MDDYWGMDVLAWIVTDFTRNLVGAFAGTIMDARGLGNMNWTTWPAIAAPKNLAVAIIATMRKMHRSHGFDGVAEAFGTTLGSKGAAGEVWGTAPQVTKGWDIAKRDNLPMLSKRP